MTGKVQTRSRRIQASDLTEKEVDAWIAANKTAINKDLAAARKSLRLSQGREWNFSKFVAKVQKRSAAKKKEVARLAMAKFLISRHTEADLNEIWDYLENRLVRHDLRDRWNAIGAGFSEDLEMIRWRV
jgi:predicted metal-dependent hydrolase